MGFKEILHLKFVASSGNQSVFLLVSDFTLLVNGIDKLVEGRYMAWSVNLRPAGRKSPSLGVYRSSDGLMGTDEATRQPQVAPPRRSPID